MTNHSSIVLGAQVALANQIAYNDSIGGMINIMVNSVLPGLVTAVTTLTTAMNGKLAEKAQEQEAFSEQWSGVAANNGYPSYYDIWNTWFNKYGHTPLSKALFFDREWSSFDEFDDWRDSKGDWHPTDTFTDLWRDSDKSPHKNLSDWLNKFRQEYNTIKLDYQQQLSNSQKPIDQWATTINNVNKTQIANYILMKPLNDIAKNIIMLMHRFK